LNLDELTKGLRDYGTDFSANEARQLFTSLDTDASGAIDFSELLLSLRPPMSKARIELVQMAFRKMDKNGDGVITPEDLKSVYNVRFNWTSSERKL